MPRANQPTPRNASRDPGNSGNPVGTLGEYSEKFKACLGVQKKIEKRLTLFSPPSKTVFQEAEKTTLMPTAPSNKPRNNPNMKTQTLLNRVDARLAGYATLAGAALAAPAFTPSAEADIVYSGPVNITIPSTTQGVYLNVVSGAFTTLGSSTGGAPGWDVNPFSATSLNMFNPAAPTGGVYVGSAGYFNLTLGTLISGASTFSSGVISATSPNPSAFNSSNNLIGFRFVDPSINGGATTYGWMRISLGATSGAQPRAIVEYAYENTLAGIGAGVIPEPSTLALLSVMAVGAVGVRAWRKRKAA